MIVSPYAVHYLRKENRRTAVVDPEMDIENDNIGNLTFEIRNPRMVTIADMKSICKAIGPIPQRVEWLQDFIFIEDMTFSDSRMMLKQVIGAVGHIVMSRFDVFWSSYDMSDLGIPPFDVRRPGL